ncbi:MAG: thiamine diphosphokinase [Candidatus Eisenbacteria bacterium]
MGPRITIEDEDRGTWALLDAGPAADAARAKRALIVLAGAGFAAGRLLVEAGRTRGVVAADAGAVLCLAADLVPDAVVGDFDSLPDAARTRLDPALLHRSTDDGTNDLEKALEWVAAHWPGCDEVVLAAGGNVDGGRMDHALANLGPVVHEPHGRVSMVDGEGRLFALRSGRATLGGLAGHRLSLLPWSLHGVRVSEAGVRYPLERALLFLGGRGVSNEVTGDEAVVTVHEGVALVWVESCPRPTGPRWRARRRRSR